MIHLTESARREIETYFENSGPGGLRIYLAPGGCTGPSLGLALDEPDEGDASFEVDGFIFAIEKSLLEQVKSVKIDLDGTGFIFKPEIPLAGTGNSACGGSNGSCGSCCAKL